MINIKTTTTGGAKLEHALKGLGKGGVEGLDVGVFSSARYPDGTPVAAVGLWSEFGTRKKNGEVHIPQRPWMRNGNARAKPLMLKLIKERVDPLNLVINYGLAELLGVLVEGEYKQEMADLKKPENAEVTVKGGPIRTYHGKIIFIKGKGDDNPLIDEGTLRTAITYQVVT